MKPWLLSILVFSGVSLAAEPITELPNFVASVLTSIEQDHITSHPINRAVSWVSANPTGKVVLQSFNCSEDAPFEKEKAKSRKNILVERATARGKKVAEHLAEKNKSASSTLSRCATWQKSRQLQRMHRSRFGL